MPIFFLGLLGGPGYPPPQFNPDPGSWVQTPSLLKVHTYTRMPLKLRWLSCIGAWQSTCCRVAPHGEGMRLGLSDSQQKPTGRGGMRTPGSCNSDDSEPPNAPPKARKQAPVTGGGFRPGDGWHHPPCHPPTLGGGMADGEAPFEGRFRSPKDCEATRKPPSGEPTQHNPARVWLGEPLNWPQPTHLGGTT